MALKKGGLELFFSPASRESAVVPQASVGLDFFGPPCHGSQEDLRSGFLEDSIKDLWPQVTTQLEVNSGFLDEPKKLHWQSPMRYEIWEKERETRRSSEAPCMLPEPDSEPECQPAPEPAFKLEKLWQSTVEALEHRGTWHWRPGPVLVGPAPRSAFLALYGISSELFQVDEARGVVRYRPDASEMGPLDRQMLRGWAVSCSKCVRLKALSQKLVKNPSLTSQALGAVLKELLQAFYRDISKRHLASPRSFVKLHVATVPWLRRLQPVFALCHVDDIDRDLAAVPASPLPKLPQGIELLEHIFHSCRVHEISNCHFQACHRQLAAHLIPADAILLWIFQRTMQPFLDCLLSWTMDGCAEHWSVNIPKEFDTGKKKIRFPGFLSSVEYDIQEMANKLSILGLQVNVATSGAPQEVASHQPGAFFETQDLQSGSFLGMEHAPGKDMALADSQRSLAVHFAVPAEATEPTAEQQMPRPSAAESPPTFFELPKPTERSERSERSDVAKRKEEQASKNSKGQELRKALDAQVLEKRALQEAAKKLDIEEEAKERALLGEPEDDEMLLGEFRQQLLEEHHREQRRIAEELVLLRWKLERRKAAEQLRRLYAAELQGLEPPAAHLATPRRISVEEILQPAWGPVVNPFDATEQRSPVEESQVSHPLTPDANLQISVDESAELGDESLIEDADPHMQVVQHVLRQLYSACAVRLAEAATPLESTAGPQGALVPRPVLGLPRGYSLQISEDVVLVRQAGSRPIDAALESCLLRPLRQQSQWVDLQVVQKALDLQLLRRMEMLRRYLLMGESRLLEPFLTEAMATYAASKGPVEASEVRRAEVALNTLFQSMVPRPSETSDDNFLSSMTLHLATVPTPIGHGPVRLLDGLRFSLKLDFPMKLFFSEKIMLQYSRLFRMIALVNHTLECLKGSWWFLASTSYGMTKSGGEMRSLAALRQGLHHFASTLHRYLHVGVVAAEFHKLQQQVKCAVSLDQILMAHQACLGHCLAKAFLDTSRLEGAKDALAAVVGILDQALQLQCLLEEVAATGRPQRSFPAWAFSRVHSIHGVFLDLRRSLQLCRPGGDGLDLDIFEEDFFEGWLLQWSRHCDQK